MKTSDFHQKMVGKKVPFAVQRMIFNKIARGPYINRYFKKKILVKPAGACCFQNLLCVWRI